MQPGAGAFLPGRSFLLRSRTASLCETGDAPLLLQGILSPLSDPQAGRVVLVVARGSCDALARRQGDVVEMDGLSVPENGP